MDMEILVSLSSILKDIIKDVEDENTKQDFVIEHIKNVSKTEFWEVQLPQGNDWFNVSKPLSESDLRGKVVVLDFFTYCCINCLHIIPHLRALEENFSVADGLVVIGVHSAKFENEKNSSNIALALKRYNVTHPVVNDSNGFMWDKLKISCWPTILILGPEGRALFILIGEQCRNELFLYVESTLKYYKNEISPHLLPTTSCCCAVTSSVLNFPGKIASFKKLLAISDSGNHRILIINDEGLIQYKIGGKSSGFEDGSFHEAKFNSPQGIAFYNEFKIYVADTENHAIRVIDLCKQKVKTVAGTGVQGTDLVGGNIGTAQEISSPWDLCFVPSIYVKDCASSGFHLLAKENMKIPSDFSNLPSPPPPPPPLPPPFLASSSVSSIPEPPKHVSRTMNESRGNEENEMENSVVANNVLLIAMSGIHQIWALFLEDTVWWKGKKYEKRTCAAIAGTGKEENRNNNYPMMASFAQPSGLTYNARLKSVFIADSESSSIRKMSLEDGSVSHVVGGDKNPVDLFNFGDVDGKGYNAKLQHPLGLTCSKTENIVYICDTYNNKVKKVDLKSSVCSSLNIENASFNEPSGCVLDEKEENLYITDTNNNSILKFNLKNKLSECLTIREEVEDLGINENTWELETEVSSNGGSLTIILHLGPEDIHGNWKLDVGSSKVESDDLKGQISSAPQELRLRVLPTETGDFDLARILFNLAFCEKDVCIFKKFLLKLLIKRSHTGKEMMKLEFRKVVK